MKTAIATLTGTTPYSQSRYYEVAPKEGELKGDYEERTWRHRMHTTKDGHVLIPSTAFKNCLAEAARYMSEQIPGKGKSTFTKHFEAGVMVSKPLVLPILAKDVPGEHLFVPASGRRGDGKRVIKCFPFIQDWSGDVEFIILDDIITEDVFTRTLKAAGSFIGIGRFRPRNNGYYGRFDVTNVKWTEDAFAGVA